MTMADRIVVMQLGHVEQTGAPLELYDRPNNLFVAGFIGSPAMNFLDATIRRQNGSAAAEAHDGTLLPLPAGAAGEDGQPVVYGVRPEHLELTQTGHGLDGEVVVVEPTGAETDGGDPRSRPRHPRRVPRAAPPQPGRADRAGADGPERPRLRQGERAAAGGVAGRRRRGEGVGPPGPPSPPLRPQLEPEVRRRHKDHGADDEREGQLADRDGEEADEGGEQDEADQGR
jgi:hypothetical protein